MKANCQPALDINLCLGSLIRFYKDWCSNWIGMSEIIHSLIVVRWLIICSSLCFPRAGTEVGWAVQELCSGYACEGAFRLRCRSATVKEERKVELGRWLCNPRQLSTVTGTPQTVGCHLRRPLFPRNQQTSASWSCLVLCWKQLGGMALVQAQWP